MVKHIENRIARRAGKPSVVIRAMIEGLKNQSKREDFRVNMGTFGEYDATSRVCYGCAATCTLQQMYNIDFPTVVIEDYQLRADAIGETFKDVEHFEMAVDSFRVGHTAPLFKLFNITPLDLPVDMFDAQQWYMGTTNWEYQIPMVEKFAKDLEEKGF